MYYAYVVVSMLIGMAFYIVLTEKNLIKVIAGINIFESALVLLLVLISYRDYGTAPILDQSYEVVVDPIPQALALTAIVIGASTTALMLALTIKLYKKYGTVDIDEINRLRG